MTGCEGSLVDSGVCLARTMRSILGVHIRLLTLIHRKVVLRERVYGESVGPVKQTVPFNDIETLLIGTTNS